MFILGLTGSIGMGKTVAAGDFRRLGIPVHDSDAAVHALMAKGGACVDAVADAFPGVAKDGAIDRAELGRRVFGDLAGCAPPPPAAPEPVSRLCDTPRVPRPWGTHSRSGHPSRDCAQPWCLRCSLSLMVWATRRQVAPCRALTAP